METFELFKDGITFSIKCSDYLAIDAHTATEKWRCDVNPRCTKSTNKRAITA